jgi:hypothetical protein
VDRCSVDFCIGWGVGLQCCFLFICCCFRCGVHNFSAAVWGCLCLVFGLCVLLLLVVACAGGVTSYAALCIDWLLGFKYDGLSRKANYGKRFAALLFG